ncbi:hypothetical protein OAH70_05990 [Flavobacteriaceae bacterium]|nr:hypothetical protein [Flavobacteriaceae bacterium]
MKKLLLLFLFIPLVSFGHNYNLIYQGYPKGGRLRNWTLEELLVIAIVVMIYCYFRFIRK